MNCVKWNAYHLAPLLSLILAPCLQCCRVRMRTEWRSILEPLLGPHLSIVKVEVKMRLRA